MTGHHASIDWSLPRWQIGRPDYCNKCICNKCKSKNCKPCNSCKKQPIENCKDYEGIKTNPTAKEMFEALGYKFKSYSDLPYALKSNIVFENSQYTIVFNTDDKDFKKYSNQWDLVVSITITELKAINKQVEELGW